MAYHFLVINDLGELWAWGNGGSYQLGTGSAANATTPTKIGTKTDWVQASAGNDHSMMIDSSGALYGVGYGTSGQLGQGALANFTTVTQIGTDMNWKYVFAGLACTFAIKTDGTMWGWGTNTSYQLGQGTNVSPYSSPVQIGTDTDWKFVSQDGATLSYGIKTNGTLWMWGTGGYGVGMGYDSSIVFTTPTQFGTDSDWKMVGGGNQFTIGLKEDGTLYSWGLNSSSYLGSGDTNNRFAPRKTEPYTDWKFISVGYQHAGGIRSDSSLWMWGRNDVKQVDGNTTTAISTPTSIFGSWAQVQCGYNTTLASGVGASFVGASIWTWGGNGYGQAGNGGTVTPAAKAQIAASLGGVDVTKVGDSEQIRTELHLIKVGPTIYKYVANAWTDTGLIEPLTESNFRAHGMSSYYLRTQVTAPQIDILGDAYEVLSWSDGETPIRIVVNKDEPSSVLDYLPAPRVMAYTEAGYALDLDITGQTMPQFRYKVELLDPYTVIKDWTSYITQDSLEDTILISQNYINQSLNPYTIRVSAQSLGTTQVATQDFSLSLFNTAPTLNIAMTGMKVTATLGDAETNNLKYKVRLNGNAVYPKDGTFTTLDKPTIVYEHTFRGEDVILKSPNVVEVIVEDEFQEQTTLEYVFTGDYTGLMFSDELGAYFTDDLGRLLQYLDFGTIFAGQTSVAQKVRMTNKYPFSLQNVRLTANPGDLPAAVEVFMDTDQGFSIPRKIMTFAGPIAYNDYIDFYVRITAGESALAGGSFEIDSKADPVA